MKIGDLVRVKACPKTGWADFDCVCFFCTGKSNRIGFVLAPASHNRWIVMFDCGEARLDDFDEARGDVEVINECR
jgi:hypothetical protein|tara:strand:+ start:373 stop:597 length:225 start_codon:yes stop_codon:yes gene_type:complete